MLKSLFFDLGSTLLDESSRVRERIETTAQKNGMNLAAFEVMLADAVRQHPYAIQMELPDGMAWASWPKRLDPLYPGVPALLAALHKKYKLGIIANHGQDTAERLDIAQYIDAMVVSETAGCRKPDPHIFNLALEQAGCLPHEAVMIGDRLDNDIAPAKRLGMRTIWVRQGWGGAPEPMGEEHRPDAAIDDVLMVQKALLRLG